jgi:hypothetical protein
VTVGEEELQGEHKARPYGRMDTCEYPATGRAQGIAPTMDGWIRVSIQYKVLPTGRAQGIAPTMDERIRMSIHYKVYLI